MPGDVAGFSAKGGGGLAGNPPGWVGAGRGAVIRCGFGRRGMRAVEGAGHAAGNKGERKPLSDHGGRGAIKIRGDPAIHTG